MEGLVKGFVSKGDLDKSMYNLKKELEKGLEGSMKTTNLDNLQIHMEKWMGHMEENGIKIEEWMGHMEENGIKIEERMGHMEDNIESIVKILQNTKENIPKGDEVG